MKNKKLFIYIFLIIAATFILIISYLDPFHYDSFINNIPLFTLIIYTGYLFAHKIQPTFDGRYNKANIEYYNLDLLKYLSAIIIIILHLRPFLDIYPRVDIFFNNLLSRICVPIFFITSGYFIAKKKLHDKNATNKYITNMIPLYLFYSLLYLPCGIDFIGPYLDNIQVLITGLNLPFIVTLLLWNLIIFIALFIALIYCGTYYHLWYFPALMISLKIIDLFMKKFKIKYLLYISLVLLILGSFETYYGLLPTIFQNITLRYLSVFVTTRNFLFFGLFYVTLGYVMYNRNTPLHQYCLYGLLLSIILLFIEVIIIKRIDHFDSNILLSAAPLVYFLFTCAIYTPVWFKTKFKLRAYSKYYYLVHPMIIFIFKDKLSLYYPILNNPFIIIFIVLLLTHITSFILIKLQEKYPAIWY